MEDGDVDADKYGFWFGNGEEYSGSDCMYHYWPEMDTHANPEHSTMGEKMEERDKSWKMMDFRAGKPCRKEYIRTNRI